MKRRTPTERAAYHEAAMKRAKLEERLKKDPLLKQVYLCGIAISARRAAMDEDDSMKGTLLDAEAALQTLVEVL